MMLEGIINRSRKLLAVDTKEEKCWFNMYCTALHWPLMTMIKPEDYSWNTNRQSTLDVDNL